MGTNYQEALGNPQAVYDRPGDVLRDGSLTNEQKRKVLRGWEAEAIHLQESDAEGFGGGEHSHLDDIERALEQLAKTS